MRSGGGSTTDRVGALVEAGLLALLGAGILLDAAGYPPPLVEGTPGPAFFPRLLASLLIAAALALAFRPSRTAAGSAPPGTASPSESPPDPRGALRLLGAAAWVAGFLAALPLLGHLVALPPLVGGLMWLSGERSRRTLIAAPLGFGAFVHLLFVVALGVPLP